ncbi:TasA family protein [Streptomyces sp. NPDC059002]|uniref:TasA family protein n=1 Tax=Streptomyces sp. NPDC059002 TaxID=3346690 RepID=UPI0036D1BA2B
MHDLRDVKKLAERKKRTTVTLAALGLGLTLIGAGAFAAWTATDSAETKDFSTATVGLGAKVTQDIQVPNPGKLLPGDEVKAKFDVHNTSDVPVNVKGGISLEGVSHAKLTVTITDKDGQQVTTKDLGTFTVNEKRAYTATVKLAADAGNDLQGKTGLKLKGTWTGTAVSDQNQK